MTIIIIYDFSCHQHEFTGCVYSFAYMAKARVAQAWGASLAELRYEARLSATDVVRRLKDFGVQVDRASIYNYEAGKVSAPDAGVVWALAHIYGVSVEELIAGLVADRSGERPNQGRKTAPELQSQPAALSEAEATLIRLWRELPSHKRKACLEFVRFQLQEEPGETQRRRPRQSTRLK